MCVCIAHCDVLVEASTRMWRARGFYVYTFLVSQSLSLEVGFVRCFMALEGSLLWTRGMSRPPSLRASFKEACT